MKHSQEFDPRAAAVCHCNSAANDKSFVGAASNLPLLADFSRSPHAGLAARACVGRISCIFQQQIAQVADELQATSADVVLASCLAVLYRHSGQSDLPVAVRRQVYPSQGDSLGGHDSNCRQSDGAQSPDDLVLLRVDVSPEWSFAKLVNHVHKGLIANADQGFNGPPSAHIDCRLDEPAVVSEERAFAAAVCACGAMIASDAPLDLRIRTGPGGAIELAASYDSNLFSGATISRLLEHWEVLLSATLRDPAESISRLPLVCPRARELILEQFNATAIPYARQSTIHALFEDQVEQSAGRVAVAQGDQTWTYAELNASANQLAWKLRGLGVGPGVPVGVCLDRSWELIVALLGILKAGGAYAPLDPNYPAERLAFMLADLRPTVMISTEALRATLPEFTGITLCLDATDAASPASSTANLPPLATATDLAYVMYTSGSEGTPKGVSVVHRGVVRLVHNTDYAHFGPDEVFLQLAPISFDASTFEIWGCLLHGARLVLMPPRPATMQEIGEALARYRVTTLWLTAPLFHQMVDYHLDDLQSLRQLLTGGDVVSSSRAARALGQYPRLRLINGYGPTECTTFACCRTITADDLRRSSLPIGRLIANTCAYVLDEMQQPAAVGTPGELYLGGDGLASGYWNRPDLTAERFVSDPFAPPGSQSRLYRTGDRVRWLEDGSLEFLGRGDRQVKIRGFRVELGEVEALLLSHPEVAEAVVLAQVDASGEKQLAAVVAIRPHCELSVAEIRRFLASKAPTYLVPSAWRFVEALPKSPVGKLDHRALAAIVAEAPLTRVAYVAPRSPTEQTIARIWCEVLGIDRLGVHDNVFECGGQSLRAAAVAARLDVAMGIRVPLARMFDRPTIAELAEWLETQSPHSAESTKSTMPLCVAGERAPLSWSQQGLWIIEQVAAPNGAYNLPLAWRILGPLRIESLEWALQEITLRHTVLRSTYLATADGLWQQTDAASRLEIVRSDLAHLPSAARRAACRRLLTEQAKAPFDLSADLMIRARLVRLDQDEHVLLLVIHHIAADGWSLDILRRELETLYESHRVEDPVRLPPPPLQYQDFAIRQRASDNLPSLQLQLDYWAKQLAGAPALLPLPLDHTRPAAISFCGRTQHVLLPVTLVDMLSALGRQEGATLFMVLLASLQTHLCQLTGEHDLVIGVPVAGRDSVALESLIGFLVNMLALRCDLSGSPSFREVLRRARITALAAYANQDAPFERVVQQIRPVRSPAHMPLFQVVLGMQYGPRVEWNSAGLRIEQWQVETETSRYDLAILCQSIPTGELEITAEYSSDLFLPATIARWLVEWQTLLAAVAADPDVNIAQTPAGRTGGDNGVTERAATMSPRITAAVPDRRNPQTETERAVLKMWRELLQTPDIGIDDDFFSIGGTSLLAIRLFVLIEQAFGRRITYPEFFQQATVANLALSLDCPEQEGAARLVQLQSQGSGDPLFLCYSIGGELLGWRDLLRHLGADRPIVAFQPRELLGQPKHYACIEDLAADCVVDLLAHQPVGPYYLAGFSFGGIVAYEVARQLVEQGREVALLAIIDTLPSWRPPQRIRDLLRAAPACLTNLPRWFAGMLANWQNFPLRRKVGQRIRQLWRLLDGRLRRRRQPLTAPSYADYFELSELTDRSQQMIPGLFDAFLKFRPRPYAGRLSLFRARTRPLIEISQGDLGWGSLVAGGVDVHVIPGSHSTILAEPSVRTLAAALRRELSRASGESLERSSSR